MAKRKRNGAQRAAPTPRTMKRYPLPEYCDCRSVVMRELDTRDEIEAAIWADKAANSALADSQMAAFQADQRESIRLALVEVDGVEVNVGGMPYKAMDGWSMRTMRFIREFYADLNGVEQDDLKNALKGAKVLTELTDPTAAPGRMVEEDEEGEDDGDQLTVA